MRGLKSALVVASLAVIAAVPLWAGESQTQTTAGYDQVIDRITQREKQEMVTLKKYTPLVEVYIQDMSPDKDLGKVPESDHYYLGKAILSNGVEYQSLVDKTGWRHRVGGKMKGMFSEGYNPVGFVRMIYIDTDGFDRAHYQFDYVRREFLGDVRCLVFDVTPRKGAGKGRFKGRLWVEDQDFNIVRFNGVFVPNTMFGWYFHFDSWRVNAAPGMWLPAYVYSEEADLKDMFSHIRFGAQVRLWGYNQSPIAREEELGRVLVESQAPLQDQSDARRDNTPVQSERLFAREAEQNVVDRLERFGLLAPRGDVDKVLETVINNLEVSNNLDIQPEIHCRVLLTSTLESFTIGHTIVLSRGLIDVLPDEASLATMLAQELANVVTGHSTDTRYAFNDRLLFNDKDIFQVLNFQMDPKDEATASQKAVELLKNSPYKDSLGNAGLFLKALAAQSKQLPNLISPHIGNRVVAIEALQNASPKLDVKKTDQIAALPLGSRVKVNPWNDQLEMLKAKPVPILSAREKLPFEVAPFYPYLARETDQAGAAASQAKAEPTKADPPKQ